MAVLAALGLALTACGGGGGGGDQAAFCDSLGTLSEQVGDGDLASGRGLDDALDTANDLAETAEEGRQLDNVNEVRETLAEADPDEADDTAGEIQDKLEDFAEACEIDDFAQAPETTTTSTPPTSAPTSTESTGSTDTTVGTGGDVEVFAREPVPADIAAEFAALAQGCFDGDMGQCDELFNTTPVGSVDETYGDTCGGRIEDGQGFDLECVDVITGPIAVPAEVSDQATAQACFDGDMNACDTLFFDAAEGSVDQTYGGLCAGRVANTQALCVEIFGEAAFN